MSGYAIPELGLETALIVHVEQITGGDAVSCSQCPAAADLVVTSEPDMEPGPVCRVHAAQWLNTVMLLIAQLFPTEPRNDPSS